MCYIDKHAKIFSLILQIDVKISWLMTGFDSTSKLCLIDY